MAEKNHKKKSDESWARAEARRAILKVIEAYREYTGREP
jgi:hypothetical protein